MQNLFNIINSITKVDDNNLEKLRMISSVKEIKKNDYFIREGEFPSTFAFVSKGLFRYTYLHEGGKELTKAFFCENSFISAYSALIQHRESYFSIEALEDSEIIVIDYLKFKDLVEKNFCWNKFLLTLLEKGFCIKEKREREFLLYDALQRYESFLQSHPHLENRIKQHMLASYLGITPVALSRIRKVK